MWWQQLVDEQPAGARHGGARRGAGLSRAAVGQSHLQSCRRRAGGRLAARSSRRSEMWL